VVSYGLIAGLRKDEIDRGKPGEIIALYMYRRKYDQETAGIRM
jgi:hypothetical protein